MLNSLPERKLVENEVMSRKPNQKISKDFDKLKTIAEEDGQAHLLPESDPNILFSCECSDEKCKDRIKLKKSTYDKIHRDSKYFLLVPEHDIPSIERTVRSEKNYVVVEKFMTPLPDASKFNATNLNNSEK